MKPMILSRVVALVGVTMALVAEAGQITYTQHGPAGQNRSFRLFHVADCGAPCMPVGTIAGDVTIYRPFAASHPNFHGGLELKYTLDNLFCWHGRVGDDDGRNFWAIYLTTATHGRQRLQNFNTECFTGKHQSLVALDLTTIGYTESELFEEPITVEVIHERDDSVDGPGGAFPVWVSGSDPS